MPAATKAKHVRCVVKEQHLTLEVCAWYVHGVCMVCAWYVHGARMAHALVHARLASVILTRSLTAQVSTLPAGQTIVVDGELFQKVEVDGCNWMVEDDKAKGRLLQLTLTKAVQMTWLMLVRS